MLSDQVVRGEEVSLRYIALGALLMMGCRTAVSANDVDEPFRPDRRSDAVVPVDTRAAVSARHVRLDVPYDRGRIVLEGGTCRMHPESGKIAMSNRVWLTVDGARRFTSEADALRADPDGPVIDLVGHVRARFVLRRFEPSGVE